jgi:hypothetical protein
VIGNQSQAIAGGTPASPVSNTSAFVLGNNSVANSADSANSSAFVIGNNSEAITASGPQFQFAGVLGNNSSVNTSATHPVLVAIGNNKTLP